ncbi:glutathione S-transferase family protein [Achromobacter sp. Bel]|uniref:glutathione S-transferase family protein n=1 Tax=Achromobacter sp. Bel TaxID=2727415 RepID=UPI00145D6F8B|nr:glutathione S-transferase family protein [Achromobacter sp. Bel]NMK46803.1 glutathione S-transferase family protein [Achromobacter sp. Bel]
MSIVLYWHPRSSALPIACALTELGVPHERVVVDIEAGEQRRPEFLALNPNGKVPTLTVDGAPLFESLAIQLWLGERYGVDAGLWPAPNTPERLLAMSWCAWSYVSYGAVLSRVYHATHGEASRRDARQAEAGLEDMNALLAVLDGHLSRQPWILGAAYSLADLIVGAVVGYSAFLGAVQNHPHVRAWCDRINARPAMQIAV